MPLPLRDAEAHPRDIGHWPGGGQQALAHPASVQPGVASWIHDGACLNSAIDDLAAAPASLKRAPQATFCFALHSDAAPEELLQWLRSNLQWAARALRWIDCHQLHHSAPENDTETLLQTESVVLSSASLLVDSAEHSAIETSIAQVLAEEFKSPVECYLTCPGAVPLFHGGLDDLRATDTDQAVALLRKHGVAVMPGCMDAATVQQWQQQVDRQIELLEGLLAARGVARQDNAIFTFREVAARGRHRFDARLDVGPLWREAAAEALRGFLLCAPWVPAVRSMLGGNPETILSVVYARPGADAQEWHSDGPPAAEADQPYAVCVFVPLLDLSRETGCTQFWPGSHVHDHLLGFGPAAVVLETAVDGLVAAGDAVLYDYRVLHRGLPNECGDVRRDVLQVVYHVKAYHEERNYSADSLLKG